MNTKSVCFFFCEGDELIHIHSKIMFTHNASVLPISPNMGTGDLSVNKWGKSNWRYFFEKLTQIFCCKLKSNVLLF